MPIVTWMIRWVAMNISRYQVGTDGMTAFERRRGRRCNIPAVSFGEKVWYKKRDKPKDQQKSEPKWEKAIWLGHARDSNETIVGTTEGAVKTYAIKRMPEDERWDAEFIRNIRGIPQQPDPKRKGATIPISFKFESISTEGETHPSKEIPEPMSRRRGITQIELEKYGFTPGCPGCLAKQRGEIAKRGHSEACRKRIEDMMRQDGEDRKKIEAADERITRQVARRIEQEEKKKMSEDIADQDQGEEIHVSERSEEEKSDQMHENPVNPDVTMEEEKSQEEDTTLGDMIFKLSQYDPTVSRWIKGLTITEGKEH